MKESEKNLQGPKNKAASKIRNDLIFHHDNSDEHWQ